MCTHCKLEWALWVYHFVKCRGALVFEVEYHPHKKIHIIRVVFQDQAMYVCTLFRGAKLEKKGMFLVILTNFGKDMMHKLRKIHANTRTQGLFSYLKNMHLGCVLKVL